MMFPDFFTVQKQDYKTALRKYRKALRYLDVCWEKDDIDEGELIFVLVITYFNNVLLKLLHCLLCPADEFTFVTSQRRVPPCGRQSLRYLQTVL
jgi:hypothetical protein